MYFADALSKYDIILENGPLGTRLQYEYKFDLGPQMAAFDLIDQERGRQALDELYRGDAVVAMQSSLPIVLNAATFRASRNHLRARGLHGSSDVSRINMACLDFIKAIRDGYKDPTAPIFIGAPLGSMNDAYSIDAQLTVEAAREYHQEQIDIFKQAEVDFVNVVTISSLNEALGIALAAQQSGVEYTIGFVLNETGALLDGTPLHEAIRQIDGKTIQKPLGYLITCTHASVISGLTEQHLEYDRLIGVQTNGSNLSAKTLSKMTTAVADSPEEFTKDMQQLRRQFRLKIIGGCCGTSRDHLRSIAQAFSGFQ